MKLVIGMVGMVLVGFGNDFGFLGLIPLILDQIEGLVEDKVD
jgi:hypothetical protein